MALCLDTEVSPSFGERDFDLPSADVQSDAEAIALRDRPADQRDRNSSAASIRRCAVCLAAPFLPAKRLWARALCLKRRLESSPHGRTIRPSARARRNGRACWRSSQSPMARSRGRDGVAPLHASDPIGPTTGLMRRKSSAATSASVLTCFSWPSDQSGQPTLPCRPARRPGPADRHVPA